MVVDSSSKKATAHANVNIALIKYWGKRDEQLILPYTSSLSLTLDGLGTETCVAFDEALTDDEIYLNGEVATGTTRDRMVSMLDLVRSMSGVSSFARVTSHNTVPTAAGLASSASGFASLAAAASAAAGLALSDRDLSRLARRGSGSASRSIFPNFALWHAGVDDESSYAEGISAPEDFRLSMVVVVVDAQQKKISSREAMNRTVATSPTYMPWVEQSKRDLHIALEAIQQRDIASLGEVVEANALGMHHTMHMANPPINYMSEQSEAILAMVRDLRKAGLPAWATMDAGPNVKIMTTYEDAERVAEAVRQRVYSMEYGNAIRVTVVRPGDGVQVWRS